MKWLFKAAFKREVATTLAYGEALSTTMLVNGLMAVLQARGLLSEEDRSLIIDDGLLGLEQMRGALPDHQLAIDNARQRLEFLRVSSPLAPRKP